MVDLSGESVLVVGGGVAGSAAALLLRRRGADVVVVERVPEPGAAGAELLLGVARSAGSSPSRRKARVETIAG